MENFTQYNSSELMPQSLGKLICKCNPEYISDQLRTILIIIAVLYTFYIFIKKKETSWLKFIEGTILILLYGAVGMCFLKK